MKRIWITGISGTGKTTVGKKLKQRGFYVIDVDEIEGLCCWKNNLTDKVFNYKAILNKEFTDTHSWTIDEDKLNTLMESNSEYVIVIGMVDALTERFNEFDQVFILQASPDIFISRINQRSDNDFGKEESQQKELLSFYKKYESKLTDMGATAINAEKPLLEVCENIISHLK